MSQNISQLQKSIQKLLGSVPHLSLTQKNLWLKNIPTLNFEQLTALETILKEAKDEFQESINKELEKDTTGTLLSSLNQFTKKLNTKTMHKMESEERKKEATQLEKLLDL
ncbi:hypothetical protein KKG71_04680 [Patescibacteria group bacterium]|nr:hypothetical protein [Patescibacteria group bacterium]